MWEQIRAGKIFIYPTDTLYGIGCDATNDESVRKIHTIKQRYGKLFSVIPPGEKCLHANVEEQYIDKLVWGPFTYFVFPKNQQCVAPSVRPVVDGYAECSLGLRMSNHWFTEEIKKAGVPFVSTSVNISGEAPMTSLDDLNSSIRDAADIIVYEGPKISGASKKIDLTH